MNTLNQSNYSVLNVNNYFNQIEVCTFAYNFHKNVQVAITIS
jgi:hypothetical protein